MKQPVLSQSAEQTIALLHYTIAQHQLVASKLGQQLVPPRLPLARPDHRQVQRQATLVRLVSVTEAFCSARLIEHVEANSSVSSDPISTLIWEKASIDTTSNWSNQRQAYSNWLGVKPAWARIEGLIEARNSISHGLGRLTRRQLRNAEATRNKVTSAGLAIKGDAVELTDDALLRAAKICAELVAEIDLKMP